MKIFKKLIFLFAILFFTGCTANDEYITKMVSSSEAISYNINDKDELLKANVIIKNVQYKEFLNIKYSKKSTFGSGFIFKEDSDSYYVLTNYHVASKNSKYDSQKVVVEDYFNNTYKGRIIYSDINYDLSVIEFSKKVNLKVLSIKESNENVRNSIRTIGNPSSVKNVISDGKIICYNNVGFTTSRSNIDFEVIVHNATIKKGSSGSAILNDLEEVVGINFAGVFDKKGNFVTGYAIPASKINEFLKNI